MTETMIKRSIFSKEEKAIFRKIGDRIYKAFVFCSASLRWFCRNNRLICSASINAWVKSMVGCSDCFDDDRLLETRLEEIKND
jgi:hypothetical protein